MGISGAAVSTAQARTLPLQEAQTSLHGSTQALPCQALIGSLDALKSPTLWGKNKVEVHQHSLFPVFYQPECELLPCMLSHALAVSVSSCQCKVIRRCCQSLQPQRGKLGNLLRVRINVIWFFSADCGSKIKRLPCRTCALPDQVHM